MYNPVWVFDMDGSLLERQKTWKDPGRPGHKKFPFGIQGASISASHTGFRIVGPDILLDAGLRTREQPRAILITHTHTDHCHEVTKICMNSKETFNIWLPSEAIRPMQEYFAKYSGLRGCTTKILWNSSLYPGYLVPITPAYGFQKLCTVYPESITPSRAFYEDIEVPDKSCKRKRSDVLVGSSDRDPGDKDLGDRDPSDKDSKIKNPGDDACGGQCGAKFSDAVRPMKIRRKLGKSRPRLIPDEHVGKVHPGTPSQHIRFYVRGIYLKHSIATMGYVIGEERKRLSEEIVKVQKEMEPKAFREFMLKAKREGKETDVVKIVPILAYLCDCTSESAIAAIEKVCTEDDPPSVIMVECTFIDDADAQEALSRKHVLWSKVAPTFAKHPEVTFLLFHFSQRYKDEGTLDEFAKKLPENVYAFT